MAIFNDRTGTIAFYIDADNNVCCSDSYADAKNLIFGCKACIVIVVEGKEYFNNCRAVVSEVGTDYESMLIEFADAGRSITFNPDGSLRYNEGAPM